MEVLWLQEFAMPGNLTNFNVSFYDGIIITLFSMGVVCAVLIFLQFAIKFETFVINILSKKSDVQNKSLEESGIENDEEIVAAIMAALSLSIGVSINQLNIKSIKRVNGNITNWRNEAIKANIGVR